MSASLPRAVVVCNTSPAILDRVFTEAKHASPISGSPFALSARQVWAAVFFDVLDDDAGDIFARRGFNAG